MGRPRKNAAAPKAVKAAAKTEKPAAAAMKQLRKVQAPKTSMSFTLVSFKKHDNGNADIVVQNEEGKFTFTGVFKTIGWKPKKGDSVVVERQSDFGGATVDFSVLRA